MKKYIFVLILVLNFLLIFVSCDNNRHDIKISPYSQIEEDTSWNKADYIIKGGYNTNGTPDDSDDYIEWLNALGFTTLNNSGVKTIEFVQEKPQTFQAGKSFTSSCDITSDTNGKVWAYYSASENKIWIVGQHIVANPNCNKMFLYATSVTNMPGIQYLDTSEVTDAQAMFYCCMDLTSLDVSTWNTLKINNMNLLFSGCASLGSLNLSNFDTANVTNMSEMFGGCSSMTNITVGQNWSMNNIAGHYKDNGDKYYGMFFYCTSLQTFNCPNSIPDLKDLLEWTIDTSWTDWNAGAYTKNSQP